LVLVCILYSVCSLQFTPSLHFVPSLQSAFCTDRFFVTQQNKRHIFEKWCLVTRSQCWTHISCNTHIHSHPLLIHGSVKTHSQQTEHNAIQNLVLRNFTSYSLQVFVFAILELFLKWARRGGGHNDITHLWFTLSYLHDNGIVYWDLKTANILISNQHNSSLSAKGDEFKLKYQSRLVACKLTDLGESRSLLAQTHLLLKLTTLIEERAKDSVARI